jgi:hypothetical protein
MTRRTSSRRRGPRRGGATLFGAVRATDYLARYGGDEFVVLLPETQLHEALSFGEKLRAVVAAKSVPIDEGAPLRVTISVGAASLAHTQFNSTSEMIAAADQALYRAKRNGRIRVEGERRRAPRSTTPGCHKRDCRREGPLSRTWRASPNRSRNQRGCCKRLIYAAALVDTDRRIETISAASGAPNTPSTPRGLKSVYGDE